MCVSRVRDNKSKVALANILLYVDNRIVENGEDLRKSKLRMENTMITSSK